jgi:selenocysteine lyase/cysteine desulfurase
METMPVEGFTLYFDADGRESAELVRWACEKSVRDGKKRSQILADNRIIVTVRGHEVRISPHFFNTDEEVDQVLGVIGSV